MQRFFLKPHNIKGDVIHIDDPLVIHQMSRVLRMRPNDHFIALDNTGFEFECSLVSIDKDGVKADIFEKRPNQTEPEILVTLYQAMPKKMELFEMILQKCTEIGVSEFVPLITEFTERAEISKYERLGKILREAAEQSERGKIPVLRTETKFADAISGKLTYPILLHSRGNLTPLSAEPKVKKCEIFIGPEGGFSENEVELAKMSGFKICSLGKRILRTETAAIVSAALLLLNNN
jgi:16S rRNA (uracil1498-N3)-methyltransferase